MKLYNRLAAGLLLATLAGCGGGGGSATGSSGAPAGSGSDQTLNIGNFVTRVSGTTQQPISVGAGNANISGVAGGTISSLTLNNPVVTPANSAQTLAQSHILFIRNTQLFTTGISGEGTQELTFAVQPVVNRPAWSPDGSHIVFTEYVAAVGRYQIFTMSANGTGSARLSDGTSDDFAPTWNPVNNKIAFQRNDRAAGKYQIYVMGLGGGAATRLSDGTTIDQAPVWSPGGDKLAYDQTGTGLTQVAIMNADGSGVHTAFPVYSGYRTQFPSWSPDGARLTFTLQNGSANSIYVGLVDGSYINQVTPGTDFDDTPSWSPDGTRIAFARTSSTGLAQVYTVNPEGSGLTHVSDGTSNDIYPAWSPYVRSRRLVGAGGLATTAAGFLAGQQGSIVSSVVVFNATTPDTAFISVPAVTNPSQPTVALTVTADMLTSLLFVNNFTVTTTVLNATTTATGAVVVFSANDGTVTTVLPFKSTKAAAVGGSAERKGDELIFRRSFVGVWDSRGMNRAPGGATEVRVNSKTGKLISYH